MFDQYKLVSSSDDTSEDVPNSHTRPWHKPSFATAVIAVLSLANILLLGFSFILWRAAVEAATAALHVPPATLDPLNVSKGLAKVEALPVAYIPFHWNTPWGAPNATEADPLWDNINTAHGHIAVDHEWAAENNWLPSMDIPGEPGKGMYLLQAYHQLHCLRIVRTSLLSLTRETPPKYPMHHILHCFDTLRQHIMCHADNTPLYGHGDGMAGDGQMHQCKDWNALRDYATKNTACFRDGKPGMSLEDHFGHCDDGTDGLEDLASVDSR